MMFGNIEAIQIAVENNATNQFYQVEGTPFFRYFQDGLQHEI